MHTRKKRRYGGGTVPVRKLIVPLRWQPLLWLAVIALAFAMVALAPVIDDKVEGIAPAAGASYAGPGAGPDRRALYTPAPPLADPALATATNPQAGHELAPAPPPASATH